MSISKFKPIYFAPTGVYRPFCGAWWLHWFRWLSWGWITSVREFWHRGRYGWCVSDVWNLDVYLLTVMGQSLIALSESANSAPYGYPHKDVSQAPLEIDEWGTESARTDFDQWKKDVRSWGEQLLEFTHYDTIDLMRDKTLYEKRNQVIQEMLPWWDSLWD